MKASSPLLAPMVAADRGASWIVAVVTCLFIGLIVLRSSILTVVGGDEQQFITSAFLVAEQHLVPYRDFPYFHMPVLMYLYAPLFKVTAYPFLAARLLSGLCTVAIAVVIFFLCRSRLARAGSRLQLIVPVAVAIVFAGSPIAADGARHVWNHATATLSALAAFLLFCRGVRGQISVKHLAMSGFFLGLATSTRLTFAPLLLPFVIAMFLPPLKTLRRRLAGFGAFAAGGIVASLPALYFLLTVPDRFLFGNLGYEALSVLYRQAEGQDSAMTLGGKLEFLLDYLSRTDNLLIIALAVLGAVTIALSRRPRLPNSRQEVVLLLLLLPFLFFGSIAPTPSWPQYYFAPMVFLSLLSAYLLAELPGMPRNGLVAVPVAAALLVSLTFSFPRLASERSRALASPRAWVPVQLHEQANEIAGIFRQRGGAGRILTLAPAVVVEAGLPVYPEFVSGRFAWRASYLMTPEERHRQAMVSPAELDALLQRDPPGAILTGDQPDLEQPLIDAARRLGFQPIRLAEERTLWMP